MALPWQYDWIDNTYRPVIVEKKKPGRPKGSKNKLPKNVVSPKKQDDTHHYIITI